MAAAAPSTMATRGGPCVRLRRTIMLVAMATVLWVLAGGLFVVDTTEYGVVTRFGRVVRVIVVTWRIADPERFLETVASRSGADERLADVILAEIGSVLGRHPSSALISSEDADSRNPRLVSEIRESIASFARGAYGIEVADVSIQHVSLPEQNRQSVFERMKAERGQIAKRYRSEGELESKRIIAEADREKVRIDAEAYAEAQRLKAEGDAEASRIYATAFSRNPSFYHFLRTLQAYEKILDESTTLVLPTDAEALGLLHDTAKAENRPTRPPRLGSESGGLASGPQPSEGDVTTRTNGGEHSATVLDPLGARQDHGGP